MLHPSTPRKLNLTAERQAYNYRLSLVLQVPTISPAQVELMKDLDAPTRRYARPIAGKYTVEQLKAQVGKETGVVFIAVPIEWVKGLKGGNTLGNRQQIANRVPPLLGEALCCRIGVFSGTSKPIGTVSIPIQQLSEEGAVRLGRGFLRLTGEDGISVRKGVAVHEKHSLTACNFTSNVAHGAIAHEVVSN
jgi:hypothetical protein